MQASSSAWLRVWIFVVVNFVLRAGASLCRSASPAYAQDRMQLYSGEERHCREVIGSGDYWQGWILPASGCHVHSKCLDCGTSGFGSSWRKAVDRRNRTGTGPQQLQADMDFGGSDYAHLGLVLHLLHRSAGGRRWLRPLFMSIVLESKQATEETRLLSIWMNQWITCKIPFVLWTSWLIQLYMCQWRFWVNCCEIRQASCFCFLAPPELETVILASGEFRHTNLNSQGYNSNNLNCLALAFMWILLPLLWVLVIWDWQGFDFQFALKAPLFCR